MNTRSMIGAVLTMMEAPHDASIGMGNALRLAVLLWIVVAGIILII